MSNVDAKIKIIFREFRDIFDNWHNNYPSIKKSVGQDNGQIMYIPNNVEVFSNSLDGLKLKDGIGFITIQQIVNKAGETVAYNYRFVSSEYEYLVCKKNVGNCDIQGNFHFHFDKCENNIPHKPHVSVMSPSFRYISSDIDLRKFLEFIRDNFYLPQNAFAKRENLLVNR